MKPTTGAIVLGLSACGYPLTQLAVRRGGVPGAAVAVAVCAGLAARDAAMVAGGSPARLRRVPAALLYLELGAGVVASAAGWRTMVSAPSADQAPAAGADNVRRAAVAALFALHTIRFAIYLSPGQGRRVPGSAA